MNQEIQIIAERLSVDIEVALKVAEDAYQGQSVQIEFYNWLSQQFLPSFVVIDADGYTTASAYALKTLRQIGLSKTGLQKNPWRLWRNLVFQYLGKYAFTLFLKQQWGIEAELVVQQTRFVG